MAMTFGQRLSIDGADALTYVPEILGQPMPAQLFVLPTAPPVMLPPKKPGRSKLVDSVRLYNVAELFVLPYATTDVTGLDGKFEIAGNRSRVVQFRGEATTPSAFYRLPVLEALPAAPAEAGQFVVTL